MGPSRQSVGTVTRSWQGRDWGTSPGSGKGRVEPAAPQPRRSRLKPGVPGLEGHVRDAAQAQSAARVRDLGLKGTGTGRRRWGGRRGRRPGRRRGSVSPLGLRPRPCPGTRCSWKPPPRSRAVSHTALRPLPFTMCRPDAALRCWGRDRPVTHVTFLSPAGSVSADIIDELMSSDGEWLRTLLPFKF